jgi:hypothetical protein
MGFSGLGLRWSFDWTFLRHSSSWSTLGDLLSRRSNLQGILQVLISGLLEQLGVLESLDEFEFLLLHPLNHGFMLHLGLILLHSLLFDVLLGLHLFHHDVLLLFIFRIFVLVLNHLLH